MSQLRHRKRHQLIRGVGLWDARLIVIATEGEKTEKQYFDHFRCSHVQVHMIPTEDGKSAPEYVLERLDQIAIDVSLEDGDQLWLMIDVDRWRAKNLRRVTQEAEQKGYCLPISNPCFECWLLLHFEDIPEDNITCSGLTKRLKKAMAGYNKSKLNLERFTPKRVDDAVARARQMDENPNDRWPRKTGTHVYKVVKSILKTGRTAGQ